jgi:hypothetical protein
MAAEERSDAAAIFAQNSGLPPPPGAQPGAVKVNDTAASVTETV